MDNKWTLLMLLGSCIMIGLVFGAQVEKITKSESDDLEPAASGFLDLGSLLNKYQKPWYGGGSGYYPGGYGGGGSYPGAGGGGGGYYPGGYGGGGYNQGGYGGAGSVWGSGGYYPSTGYFPSGGNYPSGGYYPGGGYYSGGTNVIGRAGGYGGYGGYGGNGGLRSYLGYYDPDYFGKRNLGYGYYSGTNSLGFIHNKFSVEPSYVSGYRGYT